MYNTEGESLLCAQIQRYNSIIVHISQVIESALAEFGVGESESDQYELVKVTLDSGRGQ